MNPAKIILALRIYCGLALIGAAFVSPLAYSFAPVVLMLWFLFQVLRPISAQFSLNTVYLLFFALPVLYAQSVPYFWASLISLPLLPLMAFELEKTAPGTGYIHKPYRRVFSRLAFFILVIDILVAVLGWVAAVPSLLLSSLFMLSAWLGLTTYIFFRFPARPVRADMAVHRILAGKEETTTVILKINTRLAGLLWLEPQSDWIKVNPNLVSIKSRDTRFKMKVTPTLSGACDVILAGIAVDRWGLMQTRFELEPLKLHVIPRSRYAVWLAQRYLAGTGRGNLPLLSSPGSLKATQGLRQGIEFYGNRQYQAGDSLKNIDWKHTVKYNELVVKEFTEFRGSPAVLLINLTTSDAEEADKLAYNIIAAALTLGRENIPSVLAAYNHEKSILTTSSLDASQLLVQALKIINRIVIVKRPLKYLAPPNIALLKVNASRLSRSSSRPAVVLSELLKFELKAVSRNAGSNPCTKTLNTILTSLKEHSTIVVLSHRNHDSEALAYNSYRLAQDGVKIINI